MLLAYDTAWSCARGVLRFVVEVTMMVGTSIRRTVGLSLSIVLPLAAALVACGSADTPAPNAEENGARSPRSSSGGFAPSDADTSSGNEAEEEADECDQMDIVFVVDNSGSMGQEQQNLAMNFPKFGELIDKYKTKSGKALDYRLAVTTTDAADGRPKGGAFVVEGQSSCDAGPSRPWLERTDGKVADFFTCRAQVGTNGSGNERPLASLLLSLTDRDADGTNTASGKSFLRDDALLAFVILTDEDEGFSRTNPASLPDEIGQFPPLFDKLKGGERGRWAAAVIAGEQRCSSPGFGSAQEAKELKRFIADVGKNGVFSSICTGDLTEGLNKALATFDAACKSFPSGPK